MRGEGGSCGDLTPYLTDGKKQLRKDQEYEDVIKSRLCLFTQFVTCGVDRDRWISKSIP